MPKKKDTSKKHISTLVSGLTKLSGAVQKPGWKKKVPKVKGTWLTDPDEANLELVILSVRQIPYKNRTKADNRMLIEASEDIGDAGGIFLLQRLLEKANMPYEDTCFLPGAGSNVFDAAYIYPNVAAPIFGVVIENKGGTAKLGTRSKTDPTGSFYVDASGTAVTSAANAERLTQGTEEYLDEEIKTLKRLANKSATSDPPWPVVGKALEQLKNTKSGRLFYMGIRTAHDQNGVRKPLMEFLNQY